MIAPFVLFLTAATSNAFFLSTRRVGNSAVIRSSKALLNAPTDSVKVEDGVVPEYSFVNKDMRAYAMKLHTPQQAPKEGKAKEPEVFESKEKATEALKTAQAAHPETPMIVWQPERINYVQFLVDSLQVYETIESLTEDYAILAPFKSTGLERAAALREDLESLAKTYSMTVPPPGPHGPGYAAHLRDLAATNMPKFICHYYNHMFAHTAGGRMIGKRMADMLLDGTTLKFYQWDGDVKVSHLNSSLLDTNIEDLTNMDRTFCLIQVFHNQQLSYHFFFLIVVHPSVFFLSIISSNSLHLPPLIYSNPLLFVFNSFLSIPPLGTLFTVTDFSFTSFTILICQELGKATVKKIDELAATWTAEEKQTCLEETGMSFRYSGALMVYLRPPAPELNNMITYV